MGKRTTATVGKRPLRSPAVTARYRLQRQPAESNQLVVLSAGQHATACSRGDPGVECRVLFPSSSLTSATKKSVSTYTVSPRSPAAGASRRSVPPGRCAPARARHRPFHRCGALRWLEPVARCPDHQPSETRGSVCSCGRKPALWKSGAPRSSAQLPAPACSATDGSCGRTARFRTRSAPGGALSAVTPQTEGGRTRPQNHFGRAATDREGFPSES